MKELDLSNLNVSVGQTCSVVNNKLFKSFLNKRIKFRENNLGSDKGD